MQMLAMHVMTMEMYIMITVFLLQVPKTQNKYSIKYGIRVCYYATEILFFRQLLDDIGFSQICATVIFQDNKSSTEGKD
jgi:hypothetical protein